MRPDVRLGDCLEVMTALAQEEVLFDACITDGPYHLQSIVDRFGGEDAAPAQVGATGAFARSSAGFMGQTWDGSDEDGRRIAFDPETWRKVYALLKPGAFLLSFGHTRTQHRMVCAIEDAGFEIRDQIAWTYASGFPKARDVSKDIDDLLGFEREVVGEGRSGPAMNMGGANRRDWHAEQAARGGRFKRTAPASDEAKQWAGWHTALKPAWEPICVARKPMPQSVARNVLEHGTGALNIDGCRIETGEVIANHSRSSGSAKSKGIYGDSRAQETHQTAGQELGRWPGNFVHDGSPEVLARFPQTPGAQSGVGPQLGAKRSVNTYGDWGPRPVLEARGDCGSAARFFYCAKAAPADRVSRCSVCGRRAIGSKPGCHPDDEGNPQVDGHPTVKPLALMRWLCRLVTPPGGLILDPFAGTGSTGIAADREGMRSVLIEQSAAYVGDINYRLAELCGENTPLFGGMA